MDKITTYSDNREQVKVNVANSSETKKPLSRKGGQGLEAWSQLRDSNPGPVLYESTAQKSNILDIKALHETKTKRTGQRTVSPNKPSANPSKDNPPEVDSDLAEVAQAWPRLPDHIRESIRTIAASYLLSLEQEGGDE